jgi:hypothetical protein
MHHSWAVDFPLDMSANPSATGGQALAQLNSEFAGDESPEMKTYGTVLC